MYKLVSIDVDGTLLDNNFKIHKSNEIAIKRALDMGVRVILNSGRSYKSLAKISESLGIRDYVIAFNGSIVYDLAKKECIKQDEMDSNIAIEALAKIEESGIYAEPIVYKESDSVIMKYDSVHMRKYIEVSLIKADFRHDIIAAVKELPGSLNKLILIGETENLIKLRQILAGEFVGRANILFSASYMLEIMPPLASKAKGLDWLAQKLGIQAEEIITIGDNYNDLSMIEYAGMGCAVGNAVRELKKAADYVTQRSAGEGAVAEVIERFVL